MCEFRIKFKKEIKEIFVEILLIAGHLEMIDLNSLFVDGSVIKANANKKKCYKNDKLNRYREKLEQSIEKDLNEGIDQDKRENIEYGQRNPHLLSDELRNKKKRLEKITKAIKELKKQKRVETNLTDKDAGKMKLKNGGCVAGYNVQLATTKDQIIISNDVTREKSDAGAEQEVEKEAKKNIKKLEDLKVIRRIKKKIPVVKDAGYYRVNDLERYNEDKEFEYYVAMQNKTSKNRRKVINDKGTQLPEAKYNRKKNVCVCSAGKNLGFKKSYEDQKYGIRNVYWDKEKCHICEFSKSCLGEKAKITYKRFSICGDIESRNRIEERMESPRAEKLMKLRAQSVEPTYGDIKEHNNMRSFLLRGLEKVRLEFSIMCACHNLKLIINKIRRDDQNYKVILSEI